MSTLRFEYQPGEPDGFMRWYLDGEFLFEMTSDSVGRYGQGGR